MTTVTLDLPQRIYRKAVETARTTRRPIEQVVVDWIRLPLDDTDSSQKSILAEMETMSTAELVEIARSTSMPSEATHLRELLQLQEQRALTRSESAEAARLVEQEDLLTLRKAKAFYLLKQRNALPDSFVAPGK
jgi:hypothetical protein